MAAAMCPATRRGARLGGGDGAVGLELGAQLVVVHLVHQVLDVQVHALVFGRALIAQLLEPAPRTAPAALPAPSIL